MRCTDQFSHVFSVFYFLCQMAIKCAAYIGFSYLLLRFFPLPSPPHPILPSPPFPSPPHPILPSPPLRSSSLPFFFFFFCYNKACFSITSAFFFFCLATGSCVEVGSYVSVSFKTTTEKSILSVTQTHHHLFIFKFVVLEMEWKRQRKRDLPSTGLVPE